METYCLAAPRLPGHGGKWGLKSDWGGPTLLDCRTARVLLHDVRGQRPTACACHRGNATTRACTALCTPMQSWVALGGQTATADPCPPPPTFGGAIQVVCPRGPPVYRGYSVASGTSPAGSMGREALGAPWDNPTR